MAKPEEVPSPRLLDLLSHFISRTDELLGYLAESEKRREIRDQKMLEALEAIAGKAPPEVVISPATRELVETITRQVVTETVTEIKEIVKEVIPKPQGSLRDYGSVTTTADYARVAKIKVSQGKKFKLTKILVSCSEDVMFKLTWAGQDLGPEVYVMAKLPFSDWFPYGYKTKDNKDLVGDGSQLIEIQVKYPSGGTAATCYGELSGDEE